MIGKIENLNARSRKHLENLIDRNEYWITPFTLQLLGEYVYEVIEVLDKHITRKCDIMKACR